MINNRNTLGSVKGTVSVVALGMEKRFATLEEVAHWLRREGDALSAVRTRGLTDASFCHRDGWFLEFPPKRRESKCYGLLDHRPWACKPNARKEKESEGGKKGEGEIARSGELFSYLLRQKKVTSMPSLPTFFYFISHFLV